MRYYLSLAIVIHAWDHEICTSFYVKQFQDIEYVPFLDNWSKKKKKERFSKNLESARLGHLRLIIYLYFYVIIFRQPVFRKRYYNAFNVLFNKGN